MTIDVDAVYEDGVLKLKESVDLPDKAEVRVTIKTTAPARTPLGRLLRELHSKIVTKETPGLSWEEIEDEVASRRGGWRETR